MPAIGYPLAALMGKYDVAVPQNEVSKMLTGVWRVFGVFAITLSALAIFLVPMNVSLIIVIILGLAECMSGVLPGPSSSAASSWAWAAPSSPCWSRVKRSC